MFFFSVHWILFQRSLSVAMSKTYLISSLERHIDQGVENETEKINTFKTLIEILEFRIIYK